MDNAPPANETGRTTLHPPAVSVASSPRIARPPSLPRRGLFKIVMGSGVLVGLLVLTNWNATHSPAYDRAVEAESRGDFPNALRSALEHLDLRPWSRGASLMAARCLSRLDFAERAEHYYVRVRDPSIEDRHYRAYGLVRANLRDRAVAAYREILDIAPSDVSALRFEAGVLLSQSRWDEAKSLAERLTAISATPVRMLMPTNARGHWTLKYENLTSAPAIGFTLLGVVHHDVRDYDKAIDAFERVLSLDPELRSMPLAQNLFWAHLSEDLIEVGRPADAVRFLKPVVEATADVGLIDLMGRAYLQLSSLDEAERCWRQVLAIDPKPFTAHLNLGRLALQRGRPDEAIRSLTLALDISPRSYEANYSLGLAYRRIGRVDQARRFEEKAAGLKQPASANDATRPTP